MPKKVVITPDPFPEDPRSWDNLGTMVCWHRRYNLGDKHDFKEPRDFEQFSKKDGIYSLPLYLYDHSGLTIRTYPFSCPWDSGQVGWVYTDKPRIREWLAVKKVTKSRVAKALEIIENEVSLYNDFLTGDVWSFQIVDTETDEIVDACSGFYGDINSCGIKDCLEPELRDTNKWEVKFD